MKHLLSPGLIDPESQRELQTDEVPGVYSPREKDHYQRPSIETSSIFTLLEHSFNNIQSVFIYWVPIVPQALSCIPQRTVSITQIKLLFSLKWLSEAEGEWTAHYKVGNGVTPGAPGCRSWASNPVLRGVREGCLEKEIDEQMTQHRSSNPWYCRPGEGLQIVKLQNQRGF